MKNRSFPLLAALPFFPLTLALAPVAQAVDYFWNPAVLSNTWDTSTLNWASTSGGTPGTPAWVDGAGNRAFFDQTGTYTVTSAAARTSGLITVSAGNVTFAGSDISASSIEIASGASLIVSGTNAGNRIAKSGTTPITLNGTLNLSAGGIGGGRFFQLSGTGNVIGGFRHSGTSSFGGNVSDPTSPASRAGILWNGGSGGVLTLSGNNNGMSGSVLMAVANSVVKLNSATALGRNAFLRFEGGANSSLVELAAADLSRTWATGSSAEGGGGLNWSGSNAGFYATGADRTVTFTTTSAGSTPASVVWGSNGLSASTLVLGAAAATHKVTISNDINLFSAVRTFNVGNGSAPVDAALSGNLTGTGSSGLTKSGTGTLDLSGTNTYSGDTSVTAGRLLLSGTVNATAALSIAGGTVELGASERIQNTAGTSLSGGSLLTGGFSETLGVLSLAGSNVLDLGNATGGTSVVTFADSTAAVWAPGSTLSILNWNGSLAGGAGGDQLIFTAAGLPSLAALSFVDPAGLPAGTYAAKLVGSEIVPVPEPAGLLLPMGLALLFGRRRR